MDESGSVTLIFYAVDTTRLFSEPFLNILAAVGQLSRYTHVEMAIGSAAGSSGSMTNVARVFNDATGVELTDRTGMNPKCVFSQTRTHTCVFHTLPPFAQVHVPSNRLQPISRAQDDHVCSRSGWKTVFKQCDGPVSFLAKANNATELLLCRYDRTHCLVLCVRASTNPTCSQSTVQNWWRTSYAWVVSSTRPATPAPQHQQGCTTCTNEGRPRQQTHTCFARPTVSLRSRQHLSFLPGRRTPRRRPPGPTFTSADRPRSHCRCAER